MNSLPEKIKTLSIRRILERVWIWLASIYAGLLVVWGLMFMAGSLGQNGINIFSELFWLVVVLIGVSFILLPIIYWRFYAVIAWGINITFLLVLILSMVKIGIMMASDPNYLENNEAIWGPGFHPMHFALFGITSLFIYTLWRPALFHTRVIWRKIKE